ncbi:hypothetical protein [Chitinophaga sp. S165]|uniref:DUF7010 family protein n=1 Tax=Chitinophaga sp. S165 TaxID=2135462 RepID=UPI000D995EF2|nr:hypothetical protein [Chitinophaga sp. S165]PWV51553.1 hypothetical protein C7475_103162 [Chitinophaga sp. S165]
MTSEKLNELREDLSVKSKNGIAFTLSGSLLWLIMAYVWTLRFSAYDRSILVFFAGAPLLPMAFLLSKLFKTPWKNDNPLQSLAIWLNVAQLFYFPFLIFTMIKMPEYFIMVYAIITGAHFFPFAWFYNTRWYAIFAGVIALGALLLGLILDNSQMYFIPLFTAITLIALTACLYFDSAKRLKQNYQLSKG